jgi:hypothetical protein
VTWALHQIDELSPPYRGCFVSSLSPRAERERSKSLDPHAEPIPAACRNPEVFRLGGSGISVNH